MSRKSKLERARRDDLDDRLRTFHRQGADESFLELAHERAADLPRCGAASLYGEVADRALRQALAAGDLARAESILRRLRGEAKTRPLALIAAAAGHLAAGRPADAGQALARLAPTPGAGTDPGMHAPAPLDAAAALPGLPAQQAPPGLAAALAALCPEPPCPEPANAAPPAGAARTAGPAGGHQRPPIASDLERLRQLIASQPAAASGPAMPEQAPPPPAPLSAPPSPAPAVLAARALAASEAGQARFHTPEAGAVWSFHRAMLALGAAPQRAEAGLAARLGESLDNLRAALGPQPHLTELLTAADRSLSLLGALAAAPHAADRPAPPAANVETPGSKRRAGALLDLVRRQAKPLAAVLGSPDWPPVLEPLRHAVRERWRNLLELAAGESGAVDSWAELWSIAPALCDLDMVVGGAPGGGAAALRAWTQLRSMLTGRRFGELARWLAAAARGEESPARLVRLWALELWAWEMAEDRAAADEVEEVGEPAVPPPLMRAVLGLERMAAESERRLPADQQRAVAGALAERLVELCHGVFFCRSMATTAELLLRHLPDDPGLLTVALAAAVCSANHGARDRAAARIAARGVARGRELETVVELVHEIGCEPAADAVTILCRLRPLLPDEEWTQARRVAVAELTGEICAALRHHGLDLAFRRIHDEIQLFRDRLGECAELSALDVAIDCIAPGGGGGPRVLSKVLARLPGLEPVLAALEVLADAGRWDSARVGESFEECRGLALARLDERWRLWRPMLAPLMLGASRRQRQALRDRLREFERRPAATEDDRRAYAGIREDLELLAELERGAPHPAHACQHAAWPGDAAGEPGRGSERRRRQRRSRPPRPGSGDDRQIGSDETQLDLF